MEINEIQLDLKHQKAIINGYFIALKAYCKSHDESQMD